MGLIVRNDEQIQVGTTLGLTAGSSFFIFDGTNGKPDYRQNEIVVSEINGRSPMIRGVDYTWSPTEGRFDLVIANDVLRDEQYYHIHFEPLGQTNDSIVTSLIDSSFFIRKITLPNTLEGPVLERINSFIGQYEPECLKKILGYQLYQVLLTETSERISDLVYGTVYTSTSGFERYWDGLVYSPKISLIANYVYFRIQEANAKQTMGTGTKTSKPEAGQAVSADYKMIDAWQFFGQETRKMASFLWNQSILGVRVYPEFTYQQYAITMNLAREGGVNAFSF